MKFYYLAPEAMQSAIFSKGIQAAADNQITLMVLKDDFIMTKFLFDVYAYEELGVDTYCAFEISPEGMQGPLSESDSKSIFSQALKKTNQTFIDKKYLKPYITDENYQGMGLVAGVLPIENKEKFTEEYKQKVLDYLKELFA